MKFLQVLNEASSLQLGDLKKALKKDDRVNAALSKATTLDDIKDKSAFVSSLKYWIFNNENVRDFVKARAGGGKVDKWSFDYLRKLKAEDLNKDSLEMIKVFVSDLFRDITAVSNLAVSASTKKEISDFVNGNNRRHVLSSTAQKELASIPGLKPTAPITVYRGLLFGEHSLKTTKNYDGTLSKGRGLKFLEAIRKGGKVVDLSWDKPSSWSQSKEIATRFAKYGPASSNFAATMQWLDRESKKKEIDGELGFVIATRIQPEDVLLDVEKLYGKLNMSHGDEREIIVKPGTYTCKVVHKYTLSGEVDVADSESPKKQILEKIVQDLLKVEKIIPDEYDELANTDHIPPWNKISILRDTQLAKKLATNGATTASIHAFDKAMPILRDAVIDFDQLDISHFATSEYDRNAFETIKKIASITSEKVNVMVDGKKQSKSAANVSGETYRSMDSWSELSSFERDYLSRGLITSDDASTFVTGLGAIVGVDTPKPHLLRQSGIAKQDPVIQNVMNGFFSLMGVSAPDSKTEKAKMMITILRKINRNRRMMEFLGNLDILLKQLKQPASINTSESR